MASSIASDHDTTISTPIFTSTSQSFSSSSSSSTSSCASASASASSSASIWSCRPSLDEIFQCSNAELHDLIVNHPEWVDVNVIYPRNDGGYPTLQFPSPRGRWSRHHLLSAAISQGDIERIHILTQHPYIKLDVNQHNGLSLRALTHVVYKDDDALKMRLFSLLASLGASPNARQLQGKDLRLGYTRCTLEDILSHCSHMTVIRHFITTFHPMNRGITCTVPLNLQWTRANHGSGRPQPTSIFQRFHPDSTITSQQFENIITNINQQLNTQQRINMHTFCMATHPRVGQVSAVYRVFRSSPIYDPHLLPLIWRFLYISETLPATQEQAEAIERARLEKQQAQQQAAQMQD